MGDQRMETNLAAARIAMIVRMDLEIQSHLMEEVR